MPDPEFSTNVDATVRKVKDYLEIKARGGDWQRVPLLTELGGFQPQQNTVRKPTYADANGKAVTLVATINQGGNIQFALAADTSNPTYLTLLKAAAKGEPLLYKAHYDSLKLVYQGESRVQDRGPQGGAEDIAEHGFTLEAVTAERYTSSGQLIG